MDKNWLRKKHFTAKFVFSLNFPVFAQFLATKTSRLLCEENILVQKNLGLILFLTSARFVSKQVRKKHLTDKLVFIQFFQFLLNF